MKTTLPMKRTEQTRASIRVRSLFCSHLLGRSTEGNWSLLNSTLKLGTTSGH